MVFIGLSCWALYTVMIRWRPSALPPLVFLAATIGLGSLLHLPLLIWEIAQEGSFRFDLQAVATLVYFAIFPSLLAYIIWNRAVGVLGPARTGMYMHLMPIFSTGLAVIVLGEQVMLYHLFGFLCIVCGITLVISRKLTLS